jgi:hypothetical protein
VRHPRLDSNASQQAGTDHETRGDHDHDRVCIEHALRIHALPDQHVDQDKEQNPQTHKCLPMFTVWTVLEPRDGGCGET